MSVKSGDWASWEAVPLPCEKLNFWDEPYAELYDWYPWMRRFYFKREIEHNCLTVGECMGVCGGVGGSMKV